MVNLKKFVSALLVDLGKPYEYGAEGPESFDCSSLVQNAAKQAGLTDLPRNSVAQWNSGQEIIRVELEVGDLIFFDYDYPPTHVRHVGVYVGDGQMINAQSESPAEVCIVSIDEGYWSKRVIGYRRIFSEIEDVDLIESRELLTSTAQMSDISVPQQKKKPISVLM